MGKINQTSYTIFKRFCKTLDLQNDPDLIEEYKKVHSKGAAWPEITMGMKEIGILDMQIYISENHLFMIMDVLPDFDHEIGMQQLAAKPRQTEWESFVSKFQQTSSDASADQKWSLMERIYKLEE